MALTIQERLKDLRVECGLTLEQLAEQTHLSKSALGSYEADDFKDGRLAGFDTHDKLYTENPAYRKMVDLQRLEEEGGAVNA